MVRCSTLQSTCNKMGKLKKIQILASIQSSGEHRVLLELLEPFYDQRKMIHLLNNIDTRNKPELDLIAMTYVHVTY